MAHSTVAGKARISRTWLLVGCVALVATALAPSPATAQIEDPPHIEAFPGFQSVSVNDFAANTGLTVELFDGATPVTDPISGTTNAAGHFNTGFRDELILDPGRLVRVTQGATVKELTIPTLSVDVVDLDLDRASGTAPANTSVAVLLEDPAGNEHVIVTSDADGAWHADFTDITTLSTVEVDVTDGDGDVTFVQRAPPSIFASQDSNWWGGLMIHAGEYTPGTLVTLTVESPGGAVLLSQTEAVQGSEIQRNFGSLDAQPGMVVRVSDGVYTKELVIDPVTIDNIDPITDTVTGTGPPNGELLVTLNRVVEPGGTSELQGVPIDANGDWLADFDAGLPTDFDIDINTEATALVGDDDGDWNAAEKFNRIAGVDVGRGQMTADFFAADSPISFAVNDGPGGPELDSDIVSSDDFGHAEFVTDALTGGVEVVVSDGFGTRSRVLPDITIDAVDPTRDEARGTAPPNATLAVGSKCGLTEHEVVADGVGNWSMTNYPFDIIHTVEACGASPEPGVDMRWSRSVPIVTVDPVNDLIVADGFDPNGGNIIIEIFSAPGGTFLRSASMAPQDSVDENGVAYRGHAELPRASHAVDLVPGMFVRATQGSTVKGHEIAPLTVDEANPITEEIFGTAAVPPDGVLVVWLDLQFVLRPEVVDGAWEITEADRTSSFEGQTFVFPVEHEGVIRASVVDVDGDRTAVDQGVAEESTCVAAASCTTDGESDGSTDLDPVETTVTSPNSGPIRIAEEQLTRQAPDTFAFLGQQVDIDAPNATAENPLLIAIRLDATGIPKGKTPADLQIYRNGSYVPDCAADSGSTASPDPCVRARERLGDGDAQLTIRTSRASDWNAGASNDARPPTLETVSFSVNPKTQSQSTTLSATASDALSGVGGGEFFVGADPGEGEGSQMLLDGNRLEGRIGSLAPGSYSVGVRARDRAGNWGEVETATLTVTSDRAGGGSGGGGGAPTPTPSGSSTPTPTPTPTPTGSPSPIDPACDEPQVICGTNGDDILTGTDGPDVIIGGDGNDTIIGSGGDDTCQGDAGYDTINCGAGNDTITGGPGDDELRSTTGNDLISGGRGRDSLTGGRGADILIGGPGSDVMVGGRGRNEFRARDGVSDRIRGGPGRDRARLDEFDIATSVP